MASPNKRVGHRERRVVNGEAKWMRCSIPITTKDKFVV